MFGVIISIISIQNRQPYIKTSVQKLSRSNIIHYYCQFLSVPNSTVAPQNYSPWNSSSNKILLCTNHHYSYIAASSFTTTVEDKTVISKATGAKVRRFESIRTALLEYKAVYGDLNVPKSYVIPSNDTRFSKGTYEMKLWGMKLGQVVNDIRNSNTYKEYRDELLAMGFDYNKQIRDFKIVRTALLTYKTMHNDLLIPQDYIVPRDDSRYPQEVWGMKLGQVVSNIRNIDNYADHGIRL